jgi:hypothetical protein
MKISKRSFPYPILGAGRDDIQTGAFEVVEQLRSDSAFYYINVQTRLDHPTLAAMVIGEEAKIAIHVEASSGFYRRLFTFSESDYTISIPAEEIEGTIQVCAFVLSVTTLATYRVIGAHPDYDGADFSIRPGDVLAIGKCFSFEATKDFDPLKRVSSILQILCDKDNKNGPFTLDFEGAKISILLSIADHKAYAENKSDGRVNAILVQGLVVPVLTEAVINLAHRIELGEALPRWASQLKKRLTALNINDQALRDHPLNCVQQLLEHPTYRFLSEVSAIAEGEPNAA